MPLIQGSCRLVGMSARYAGMTDRGQVRDGNEDGLLLLPDAGVFAVADGLGGLDAGDVASRTALNHLGRQFRALDRRDGSGLSPKNQLGAIIAEVNRHIYEQRLTLVKNMATTLALIWFDAYRAVVAHVGDSRVYRWRQGTLNRITRDHSLVQTLCDQGALTESQARNSPQRHVITRALGAESQVLPSIEAVTVMPGDLVLLGTDGLTTMMSDGEIAACLDRWGTDVGPLVDRLVRLANEAGGHDNITVVAVLFRE